MPDELKVAGIRLQITGEAEFVKSLQSSAKQSTALKNELKLLEAGSKAAGTQGADYLRQKSALLTSQIAVQEEKTKTLNRALQEATESGKADANQLKELEKKILASEVATEKLKGTLIKNTAELDKSENAALKAGKAYVEMGDKAKRAGEKLNSAGSKMTTMVTLPILAASAAAVKYASDYQESLNKVNVAFQGNSNEVIAWSNTTLRKIGLAKGTSLDMVATYGDMATGMGFATDASAKMGVQLVERAADLASFKNISIDIANTALTSVFTGETESLKKLGVVMTEANLISYMQAEGYKKTYKELSQTEKVTLRMNYVLDMTKNSAGDFSRTIDGTANQSRLFKESLKELAETFGEELLPTITPIIKEGNAMLKSFGELDSGTKRLIINTALLAAAVGPLLKIVGTGVSIIGASTKAKGLHTIATAAQTIASNTQKAALIGEAGAVQGLAAAEGTATAAGAGLAATLGPILLVGAAVAGMGIAYAAITKESRDATNAIIEQTDAMNASNDASNDSIAAAESESAATKTMADDLFALAEQENKTNGQKAAMQSLILSLNKSIPNLNLAYDEQTDSLNLTKDAVYKLIKAKMDEIKLSAYSDKLKNDYLNEAKQTDLGRKALERYNTAYKKMLEYTANPIEGIRRTAEYYESAEALKAVSESIDITTESRKASEAEYAELAEGATEANDKLVGSERKTTVLTQEELDARAAYREEFNKNMEQSLSNHMSEMGSIETYGIEQSGLTAKEWKKNLDKQVEDMRNWRINMLILAEKVPAGFLEYLREMGPEQSQIIQDLVDGTLDLDEAVAAWAAWAEEIENAAVDELGRLPSDAAIIARETGFSFGEALNGSISEIKVNSVKIPVKYFGESMNLPKIPGFDVGSRYLPKDMLIQAHEGELIVPKSENPYANSNGSILAAVSMGSERSAQLLQSGMSGSGSTNTTRIEHAFPDALRVEGLDDNGEVIINKVIERAQLEKWFAGT